MGKKAKTHLHIIWITAKVMVQFCYLRLYFGIKMGLTWIEIWKTWANLFKFQWCACKNYQAKILWLVLNDKICLIFSYWTLQEHINCVWIYRILHGVAKIWILFLSGKTIFYSFALLVRRILFCHSKIKFISLSRRVMSFYCIDKKTSIK